MDINCASNLKDVGPCYTNGLGDLHNKEAEFEIKLYMSDGIKGFQGILKLKYSDFQVSEIDSDGNKVELKDTSIPILLLENDSLSKDSFSIEEREEALKIIKESLSDSSITLEQFYKRDDPKSEILTKCINSKQERKAVHTFIRAYFGDRLASESNEDNSIKIFTTKGIKKSWKERYMRRSNSRREKRYLEFTLLKSNKDTITAINYIANYTHLDPKLFTIAGTKDKRAVTTQKVRVLNVSPQKLISINSTQSIRVGDFRCTDSPLSLGSLKGNEFSIVIRDIGAITEQELERNMQLLNKNGFVNYFGLQRFGSRNVGTHTIGLEIIKGNWSKAFDLIMMPKKGESEQIEKAREVWQKTKDPAKALNEFPRTCVAERALLNFMKRHKDNTTSYNTILATSRSLFLLYLHSYQSLVWNYVATKRLEVYGKKVVVGDFVTQDRTLYHTSSDSEHKLDDDIIKIECIEQTLKFNLGNVTLPLPGHSVQYPPSCVRFYEEFMNQHGLDPHDMKRKAKECSLPGCYRTLISRPQNLSWSIKKYYHEDQNLLPSFFDPGSDEPSYSNSDTEKLALILKFRLNSSEYATMALRELVRDLSLSELQKKTDSEKHLHTNTAEQLLDS